MKSDTLMGRESPDSVPFAPGLISLKMGSFFISQPVLSIVPLGHAGAGHGEDSLTVGYATLAPRHPLESWGLL